MFGAGVVRRWARSAVELFAGAYQQRDPVRACSRFSDSADTPPPCALWRLGARDSVCARAAPRRGNKKDL